MQVARVEMIPGLASAPPTLAICGDPAVGRALVLLFRDPRYDAKFLPDASLGEPGALEGVRLLLFTCTRVFSAGHRVAQLASVKDRAAAAGIPVLELVSFLRKGRPGAVAGCPGLVAPRS